MALNDADDNDAERELLPCGADLAQVWDTGRPAAGHDDCHDCRGALTALGALHETVRTALDDDQDGTDRVAFLDRVMTAVRTEIRPGPLIPLGEETDDDWITEAAAARVLRAAVDDLPGVCAGSCRISGLHERQPPRLAQLPGRTLPRGPLRVAVEVFTDLSRPIPRTATLVRTAVSAAAAHRIGIDVQQVDVMVRDVMAEDEQP